MAEKVLVLDWSEAEASQDPIAWNKNWIMALGGPQAEASAQALRGQGYQVLLWPNFAPTFAALLAAAHQVCTQINPTIILAKDDSPWANILPALMQTLSGAIDTKLDQLQFSSDSVSGQRGYFRQRLKATLSRPQRPWGISLNAGAAIEIAPETPFTQLDVAQADALAKLPLPGASSRTTIVGEEAIGGAVQTLKPSAAMLVVAGAGLCKPQADGASHVAEAEKLILSLCDRLQASLGSTKSLVDQSGEGQATMSCLTHLHQIGQTGQTPHHHAGIAIGCHGEAPHVVGWRFIPKRVAINLDPQCGWVNEADYLYVADAFKLLPLVLERL